MKSSLSLLPLLSVFLIGCGSGGTGAEDTRDSGMPEDEIDTPIVAEITGASNDEPDSDDPISMGQDPMVPSTIPVSFSIAVPAYQSNELSVELVWGEETLTAAWVGDEYWSATGDFPTGTENTLTVTFYDRNGDIELASFTQEFQTGSNASEILQVLQDQFDASQFDDDGDGTSNLDELVAGTDPQINEDSLLEILDTIDIANDILSVSQQLEARLSEERPYVESVSEFTPYSDDEDSVGTSVTTDINIDADGNGTQSYSSWAPWYNQSHSGTRTHSESSISWEGGYRTYDGDYGRGRSFSNTVTIIDDNTRSFVQQIDESYVGTYSDTWEITTDITGELIEGTSRCKPISGTMYRLHTTNRSESGYGTSTTTISKDVGDSFWRVVYVNPEGEITEYLARDLTLRYVDTDGRDYPTFICDFVDF